MVAGAAAAMYSATVTPTSAPVPVFAVVVSSTTKTGGY